MVEQLYIQEKYLSFASSSLEMFKRKSDRLWNFRCPYCGDSERSSTKARGYIYHNKQGLLSFQCHNCGENHIFKTFLKYLSDRLYQEYVMESFQNTTEQTAKDSVDLDSVNLSQKDWMKFLTPVEGLSRLHPIRNYIRNRSIPKDKWKFIYYTKNFREFVEGIGMVQMVPDDPRMVLVETDKFNNLKLVVARAIQKSEVRYITLKIDESYPKVFGLGSVNLSKPIKVVEGAIDSLFLDNCIASLDANLTHVKSIEVLNGKKLTFIWDNEPRSVNTVKFLDNAIKGNDRVCIFPSNIPEKDINEMILSGRDVNSLVERNTYSGIVARLKFSSWKKTNEPTATRRHSRVGMGR